MKRIPWLLAIVAGLAMWVQAQTATSGGMMSGWICDSGCVSQSAGKATCDQNCTQKTGTAVFISDKGTVTQIQNQDMCQSHMGKHVKMKAKMDPQADQIRAMEIYDDTSMLTLPGTTAPMGQ